MKFHYAIIRQADEKLLAEGYTLHVCTDAQAKVKRLPESLLALLQNAST